MFKRMQGNYQLAIISLFGICGSMSLVPFAIYRWLTGAYAVAVLDAAIGVGIAAVVVVAWRSGHTRGPGFIMAALNNAGALLSAVMLGGSGLLWIYAVLMANFFLIPPRLAGGVALLEVAGLAIHGEAFNNTTHLASFVVSSLLVSMLAFILAHWTDYQRRQLEELASHDALTGLGNRRAMEQDLQRAIFTTQRNRMPYGLAIVDIDHFKAINDRHGHAAGDMVLVAFAKILRSSVRKVDGVYRYGGEEFLILLPGADVKGLVTVTETLRSTIATCVHGPEGNLTASLGAATFLPGESAQSWLARADTELYRAKGLGRNRACVDQGSAEDGVISASPSAKGTEAIT